MGNVTMEARDINYRGGETKMSVEDALKSTSGEAAAIAALQEAVGNLQTDTGNLQATKANLITIAPVFSAEVAYDPGDLVYYNGLTYRCVNAHEGEWDADDFAATTISGELATLKSGLTNGVVDVTSVQDVRFVKIGRVVTMITEVWHQGFTVPEEFRPWLVTFLPARVSAGGGTTATIGYIRIGTDGVLTIPDNTDFVGTLSWVTE